MLKKNVYLCPDNMYINIILKFIAGWSSLVARQAHNLKVLGSNPSPATKLLNSFIDYCKSSFL